MIGIEEIMQNETFTNIACLFFWGGFVFCALNSFIESIIDYLYERAWIVRDYERIIACNINPLNIENNEDKELIYGAINNYEKTLIKRECIFKKLFKKLFKNIKK